MIASIKNIVSIRSPLQLMCAIEFLLSEQQLDNLLLIRLNAKDESSTKTQIYNILKNFEGFFNKVIVWESNCCRKNLVIKDVKQWAIAKKKNDVRIIWCQPNDLRNRVLYSKLNPLEVVYVDDGTVTVRHMRNSSSFYKPKFGWKGKLAKFIPGSLFYNPIFGLNESKVSWVVFSFFEELLELSNTKLNDFNNIAKSFGVDNKQPGKVVWMVGSPFSESSLMLLETEIAVISQVKKYFFAEGFDLVYIAHRFDSDCKISKINDLGVQDVKPKNCIELEYLSCESPPDKVVSIGSTALVTLSKMNVKADLIRICNNKIPEALSESISQQYLLVDDVRNLDVSNSNSYLEKEV